MENFEIFRAAPNHFDNYNFDLNFFEPLKMCCLPRLTICSSLGRNTILFRFVPIFFESKWNSSIDGRNNAGAYIFVAKKHKYVNLNAKKACLGSF